MSATVEEATGPNGRAILAQSTTRLVITRSGQQILDLVFASTTNPVQQTLLKSVSDHHDMFGDGVKTFVILLHSLVTQKYSRSFLDSVPTLQAALKTSVLSANCNCVLNEEILHRVIKTFFCTRFAPVVSTALTKLTSDWVGKLNSVRDLNVYINNFSVLCVQSGPFSVSSSVVQDGFLIRGLQFKRLPSNEKSCYIKIYYSSLDDPVDDEEVVNDILSCCGCIKKEKPLLLITNLVLQDKAQFFLNFRQIYFIHGVCNDSTRFLFEHNLAKKDLLVEFQYVEDLLWVSIPYVSQLILKAPNAIFSTEYSEGIRDCLKMMYSSLKESFCTVAAGGYFELAFAKMLYYSSKTNCPQLPPVKSRKELLEWQKEGSPFDRDILKHINTEMFANLDLEAKEVISKTVLETANYRNVNVDLLAIEPLALKLEILSKALSMLMVLTKIDGAVVNRKQGRLN